MTKRVLTIVGVCLVASAVALAADTSKALNVKGWVSDSMCAAKGDKKCSNPDHLKQGAQQVLVTDGDNKIWTIQNPEKVAAHRGHHVRVRGKATGEASLMVERVTALPEPK
jgi:hypothetical protein